MDAFRLPPIWTLTLKSTPSSARRADESGRAARDEASVARERAQAGAAGNCERERAPNAEMGVGEHNARNFGGTGAREEPLYVRESYAGTSLGSVAYPDRRFSEGGACAAPAFLQMTAATAAAGDAMGLHGGKQPQAQFFRQDQAALPGSQLEAFYSRRRFSESLISPRKNKADDSAAMMQEDHKRQRVQFWGTVLSPDAEERDFEFRRRQLSNGRNDAAESSGSESNSFNDLNREAHSAGALRGFSSGATSNAGAYRRAGMAIASPSSSRIARGGTLPLSQQQRQQQRRASYSGSASRPLLFQLQPGSAEYGQELARERAEAAAEAAQIPEERAHRRAYCSSCRAAFPNKDALIKHVGRCGGRTSELQLAPAISSSPRRAQLRKGRKASAAVLAGNSAAAGARNAERESGADSGPSDDRESTDDRESKAYTCPECPMEFTQQSALKSHVRVVHNKERPFKCELCDSAFGHKGDLNRHHMIKHEQLRPFKCTTCNATFGRKSVLNRHVEKLHAGRNAPPPTASSDASLAAYAHSLPSQALPSAVLFHSAPGGGGTS
mmetsp:Transcript_2708/g.7395  ORF Transcript_2708/g.7395 Transcript_2708/m.7395 type:complete len:556 (-) Transcript_2708:897-2564(-)